MIARAAESVLRDLATQFKAIALMGPRQCGKTTLIRKVFAHKPYVSLETPEERVMALADPRQFLAKFPNGAILDEVQRTPELFSYLQQILDESPKNGLFILSGSNNFLLMESITQSLAGRVVYLDLLPFSLQENRSIPNYPLTLNQAIFNGGFPAITFNKVNPYQWFSSYVRTYIERDVRLIKNVSSLELFQRLLYLCAGRIGQQIHLTHLANEVGTDHKTIQSWLGILRASYIIYFLPPYYKNYNKRIIKTPKLYFYDTGLACSLLGIDKVEQLATDKNRGFLFENWVILEIMKNRFNKALRANLFYFRDSAGNEIDLLIEEGGTVSPIEIKSAETLNDSFYKNLIYFEKLSAKKGTVIYGGGHTGISQNGFEIKNWLDVSVL